MNWYWILLRAAALAVPAERRREWLAEWVSELWYVLQGGDSRGLQFCLGAFRDAWWVRRNGGCAAGVWLRSPGRCLGWLGAWAVVAVAGFVYLVGPWRKIPMGRALVAYLFVIAVAFLIIGATSSLSLGEYPSGESSPARARRWRRWSFFGAKLGLIAPIVICGTFDVVKVLSAPASRVMDPMAIWAMQPQAALVFFVIAFRWALRDQRRRCPVCLRVLEESASIGEFSHNFLEWYGRELFCARGHGLLHVPEIATTYSMQRWRDLDRSWSVLFR